MTPDELNAITAQVHDELLEAVVPLAKAYRKVIRGAGRKMGRKFHSQAQSLTAAAVPAKFVAPDGDEVIPDLEDPVRRATDQARADLHARLIQSYTEHEIPLDARRPLTSPELLETVGERASTRVGLGLRDVYKDTIQEAAEHGYSIPRTATLLTDRIDGMSEARATMLARTDMTGLMNGSSQIAATGAFAGREDVTKVWLATEDERTRDTHSEADGQEVPLNDFFTVGDDSLMYPGDPSGSDEEVINCRCTMIYNGADEAPGAPPNPLADVNPTMDGITKARASWDPDAFGNVLLKRVLTEANDGLTIPEIQKQAVEIMQRDLPKAPIRIRAPIDIADRVISDGQFESQFESGASQGMFNTRVRAKEEHRMFGYPNEFEEGMTDFERPIYGYLGDITNEGGTVNSYGEVAFTLKPGVRARTTFTSTDSLNDFVIPSPVNDPSIYSLYPNHIHGDVFKLHEGVKNWAQSYWEAQIHGGVTLDDVESITIVAQKEPPPEWLYERAAKMRESLAAAGHPEIQVQVIRRPIYAAKKPLLGSVQDALGVREDSLAVDAGSNGTPVAASEQRLDGKLVGDGLGQAVVDPGLRLAGSTVSAGEQHEAGLALHRDDVHASYSTVVSGVPASRFLEEITEAVTQAIPDAGTPTASEQFVVRQGAYPPGMDTDTLAAAVTITVEDDAAAATNGDRTRTVWEGILAIAGSPTSDGRYLIPGEIGQRDLPLPLAASHENQRETQTVGRIEDIQQIPAAEFAQEGWELPADLPPQAVVIWGSGTFDGSPEAEDALRQLENGVGVSLDLPMERQAIIDRETYEEIDPSTLDEGDLLAILFGGAPDGYLRGIAGKIGGLSLASIAAFEETTIRIIDSTAIVASGFAIRAGVVRDSVLTDVLIASAEDTLPVQAPLMPPRDLFFRDEPDEPTPITILPNGEFFGHLALWNTCHAGRANGAYSACMYAPHSRTNYSQFHLGAILCDDGTEVPIGRLTIGTGHAPLNLSAAAARAHYDHTGTCVAFARAKDGVFGIWLSGVIKSDATQEQVRDLRACPPSGDWRAHDGVLELQAALAVNAPGFPVARSQLALSASSESLEVSTLILSAPDSEDFAEALRAEYDLQTAEDIDMLVELGVGEFSGVELAALGAVSFKDYTADQRRRMARSGEAMPDGSFPIANCTDARNAIQSQGRGGASQQRITSHIRKRVGSLGCSGSIFDPYK